MQPLYIPNKDHTLGYGGNKIFKSLKHISSTLKENEFSNRIESIHDATKFWQAIAKINNTINFATHNYFNSIGSLFVLLPLTTKMISSPGALYGKEKIDYTQDTIPIKLKWFDLNKEVFLAESSQIYLELHLITKNVDGVYCVYNSFRREHADFSHLCEFHHIEYEGKVSQTKNQQILLSLISSIINQLLKNNLEDLSYFLFDEDLDYLQEFAKTKRTKEITFEDALDILYTKTKDLKYKEFTSKHFGAWEEVKLTTELNEMTIIKEFPLYEVAFYHAPLRNKKHELVGENADFIWPYYREFAGSGHRVRSLDELLIKAKKFNLPKEDYKNYLLSRKYKDYKETSGFGLGWERFLQGVLKMPYIYSASAFPRIHTSIAP